MLIYYNMLMIYYNMLMMHYNKQNFIVFQLIFVFAGNRITCAINNQCRLNFDFALMADACQIPATIIIMRNLRITLGVLCQQL